MDRNQAKDFFPIMQAFAEGKVIECRTKPSALSKSWQDMNEWTEIKDITYWNNIEYRIKPDSKAEAKYRPFANVEECWTEMKKHQPFGWVRNKFNNNGVIATIIFLDSRKGFKIYTDFNHGNTSEDMINSFIFADGTPFGVKVEE